MTPTEFIEELIMFAHLGLAVIGLFVLGTLGIPLLFMRGEDKPVVERNKKE